MWYVYILECKNKSLYTGMTNNLEKRLKAHKSGKGAWFTRVFGADKIVYSEECPSKRDAFIREREIKRLTREKKLALITTPERLKTDFRKDIEAKKILILNASPKKDGNTAALVSWFAEGARSKGAQVEIVNTAFLKYKSFGCTSCRTCQKLDEYECVINDEAKPVLKKMADVDVIVMATPLYFFMPSAQLKLILDRMFSLYKWDNTAGTMKTVLKGKTLALIASAFEDIGLKDFEKPFRLIAEYTGMKFESLLVPNAGVSGDLKNKSGISEKAIALGKKVS